MALTFYDAFSCNVGDQSSGSMIHNACKLLYCNLGPQPYKGRATYQVLWLSRIYTHSFFSLVSLFKHPLSPTAPISRFAICVCACASLSLSLFLCINSVPFSCRLTSERLVYFCWGENRRVFIPSLPHLQFFLLRSPPLLSDIFRQTQGYSRASYSNELIFHPGEVVWVRTDEDKWPSEGLL